VASPIALLSIREMIVLFPSSQVAIVIMAATMEAAKLVTAAWLARRWRSTAWIWRLALAGFVLGLAVINAGGTYSQLVDAHVGERGAAAVSLDIQTARIEARIDEQAHRVGDLDARVSQTDTAIAEATRRGRTTGAISIMEAQRRTRAGLVEERNREASSLAALKAERASLAAKGRQAETQAAPIRYVAAVLGVQDNETVVRWLILMMVLTCDPLAIALTAAASGRR
jgi:hypothetical protein